MTKAFEIVDHGHRPLVPGEAGAFALLAEQLGAVELTPAH